jgi:hypothetical protein
MMQPITTNMTEQVKVGLGQDFFHTDCRREDTHSICRCDSRGPNGCNDCLAQRQAKATATSMQRAHLNKLSCSAGAVHVYRLGKNNGTRGAAWCGQIMQKHQRPPILQACQ